MSLKCEPAVLPEVKLLIPDVFGDPRGFFMETYHSDKYRALGIDCVFVQDNYSHSCMKTLRGLHYQLQHAQAKLISVIKGRIFDVAVDIRQGSPRFGQWMSQVLSDENRAQLFVPVGFAHGFVVLSEEADVMYKCSDYYAPQHEHGVLWSDPALKIPWPIQDPILSKKDALYRPLSQIPKEHLPVF